MTSSAPFDIGALIECTTDVYGGQPCLAGTRFPVIQLASEYREGARPEEIAANYELELEKVYAGVAYYLASQQRLDAELAYRAEEHEALRRARSGQQAGS